MDNFPFTVIDLTQRLDEHSPSWGGICGFRQHTTLNYDDCTTAVKFRVQSLEMEAGIGTHIDAPSHCDPQGKTIDQIPLDSLIVPCVVIDVAAKADESYKVSLADIQEFEALYGKIPPHCAVFIHTGWDQYWTTPKYRNHHKYPSLSSEAAHFLLTRDIVGLGVDTLSPDLPESGYPVHEAILGSGKWIIENLTSLERLPPHGAFCMAMPIKIPTSEAPMRCIAFLKK
jgi:kynurenine formamidase